MTADFPIAFFFQPILAIDIGLSLLQLLLFFVSLWLIFLILIQRGKGGGLTAAFGGGGGDSAFGAKAGDAFTKITIVSAVIWITLCTVTIALYNPPEQAENPYAQGEEQTPSDTPAVGGASLSGGDEAETTEDSTAPAEGDGEASEGEGSVALPTDDDAAEGDAAEGDSGDGE